MGMKMKKYFMRKIKPLYIECKYNYNKNYYLKD